MALAFRVYSGRKKIDLTEKAGKHRFRFVCSKALKSLQNFIACNKFRQEIFCRGEHLFRISGGIRGLIGLRRFFSRYISRISEKSLLNSIYPKQLFKTIPTAVKHRNICRVFKLYLKSITEAFHDKYSIRVACMGHVRITSRIFLRRWLYHHNSEVKPNNWFSKLELKNFASRQFSQDIKIGFKTSCLDDSPTCTESRFRGIDLRDSTKYKKINTKNLLGCSGILSRVASKW